MATLPLKPPCTITIIERGAPLVFIVVVGHGGRWKIFGIWNNSILSYPLWKIICVLLGWFPTRAIFIWPAVFLDTAILTTLVTSHIWLDRRPSSRTTTISTVVDLEAKLIQSLVGILLNDHSVCLWKWRLFLRIFFASSQFSPLWINKIAVFTRSLFYKVLIGDELLWWYYIHITHTKFLDKLCNLLVLLNCPKT